ncbi:MAG TPA: hypothetical protein VK496_03285 [Gaiellaceae bacterium]|nr:hypothetical protein [Gaiellaceae bacterium]
MRRALAVVVIGAAIAAVLALAAEQGWWRDVAAGTADKAAISVQESLAPNAMLFGDPLTARALVVFDPARVRASSVRLLPRFGSYRVSRVTRTTQQVGRSTELVYRFVLECLTVGCAPGRPQVALDFPPAILRFVTREGVARHLAVDWPSVTVASRLDDTDRADPSAAGLRADMAPPPVSYRLSPDALVDGLVVASVLFVLAAAVFLAMVLRRQVASAPQASASDQTPLEEALALVRETASDGHSPERQRMALERLVRELQGLGRAELAATAGRLAWSAAEPSPNTALELVGRVEREVAEK